MAKKKALQKNSLQAIIVTTVIILASIGILGAAAISRTISLISGTVVSVNGEGVSSKYFEFSIYQQKKMYESMYGGDSIWYNAETGSSAEMVGNVKNSVMNQLVNLTLTRQQAPKRNIVLSETDNKDIEDAIAKIKETYTEEERKSIGADDNVIRQAALDQKYYQLVYDSIVGEYEYKEDDFNTFFEGYMTENIVSLTSMDADIITLTTQEQADSVYQMLNGGADFIEMLKLYSTNYDATAEYASTTISGGNTATEIADEAFITPEGKYSAPFVVADPNGGPESYAIVRVNSKTSPDQEEVKTQQKETYIENNKSALFQTALETWTAEAKIQPNAELYTVIKIQGVEDFKPGATIDNIGLPALPDTAVEVTPDDGAAQQ